MVVADREEGEIRGGGDGRAIVASNCIETVGCRVGEETHFGVRIDGLDRCEGM